MTAPNAALRREVLNLYKNLLYLGQSYPLGYSFFRTRLHAAFSGQSNLSSEADIRKALERGEFVKKEIEALYYLKRYRALRQRYG